LDGNAAGYGWYLDPTPDRDDDDLLEGRMDLLTVVLHEMGHLLGFEHTQEEEDLMSVGLQPGMRRLPTVDDVDQVLANGDWRD
jgi:predicted Zn-dependent protease